MAPVQTFIILSALVIFPFVWLRGGRPERGVVAILVASYLLVPVLEGFRWGNLLAGVFLIDLTAWIGMIWLCLRYDRWWLLIAAGTQTLSLMAHPILMLSPSLTVRESVAAQWAFTLVCLYSLLLGVIERRLAGESPIGWRKPSTQT